MFAVLPVLAPPQSGAAVDLRSYREVGEGRALEDGGTLDPTHLQVLLVEGRRAGYDPLSRRIRWLIEFVVQLKLGRG